ncbi:MAG: LuxR C-terminal-related transcriptional regulator [Chloroflexota bacterium]
MSVQEKLSVDPNPIENPLSEREMDVARHLATGASNTAIARELSISPHTVKVHIRNIYDKLQVNSRTEASMMLVQRGWLTVPGLDSPSETTESNIIPTAAPTPTSAPVIVPVAEPPALTHIDATPAPWQRFYLLVVIAITIVSLFTPNLLGSSLATPNLLSERGQPPLGQPPLGDDARWIERTPLYEPRSRLALAKIRDKIYIMGGESVGGRTLARTDMYDLAVNEWVNVESLPAPRQNGAAAALGNVLYFAGGSYFADENDSEPSIDDQLLRLTLDDETATPLDEGWKLYGALPTPLAGAAMVTVGETLYLIGGWDGEKMRSEIWRLVPSSMDEVLPTSWDLVNRMDVPRAFFGVILFQEKIYIVGGHDGQRELSRADIYDPAIGAWTPLPPLVTPRGGFTLVTDGRSIFAFGGGWDEPVTTHERFDPNTKLWSNFPSPFPGEWRNMVAYSHEDNLYLMGGWSGDYLDYHLKYEHLIRKLLLPLIQTN